MKKTRIKILAGAALLIGLIAVAALAGARATRTTVQGDMVVTGASAGLFWTSGATLHERGTGITFVLTGDLVGSGTGTVNNNYGPDGDKLEGWGTSILDVTCGEHSGRFEGAWTQKLINDELIVDGVLHGSGDFAGMLMKLTLTGAMANPNYTYQAVILDPHGE